LIQELLIETDLKETGKIKYDNSKAFLHSHNFLMPVDFGKNRFIF